MSTQRVEDVSINRIVGSVATGGWEANIAFANAQALADYSREGKIFFRAEGSGVWAADNVLGMRGFLLPRSIVWDRKQSGTEVTLSTSHVFLQNAALQGIYFTEQAAPANPHQITDLTMGKIVEHIVEEHTNIEDWVDTSGIDTTDSTSVDVYTVHESNSIWRTIQTIGSNEFYVPWFTRHDELMYKVHPMFAPTLPEPVLEMDVNIIIGQPEVTFRDMVKPDQARLYALTDGGETLKAEYPDAIGAEGRREQYDHLRCNSQARLDELAQRVYLFTQRNYEVSVTIPGPWGLALELYDRVEITYSGTDRNGVDFVWDQKKFWVTQITVSRTHNFGAITELRLDEESYTEGYFYSDYT